MEPSFRPKTARMDYSIDFRSVKKRAEEESTTGPQGLQEPCHTENRPARLDENNTEVSRGRLKHDVHDLMMASPACQSAMLSIPEEYVRNP
jgi:hypothetical protein